MQGYISKLAASLAEQYDLHNDGDWHWFEDSMTYCNATLPWAMLVAYQITKEKRFREIGFQSLNFLKSKTFTKDYFKPIGCNGWLQKGKEPAEFDEQPVEACEMTLAFLEAYAVSKNKKFLSRAKTCFSWYRGNNSEKLCLLDQETGGCYDGIEPDGLNLNQGAESVVSFWIAYLAMKSSFQMIFSASIHLQRLFPFFMKSGAFIKKEADTICGLLFKYFPEIQTCAQGLAVKYCDKSGIAAHEIDDSAGSNPLFWGIID